MYHTVHHHTLSNGISLVVVPLPNTASVTSMIFMGVGSRYESDAQQGLAHFTEHMVFKGGKKYTSTQAIAQALDAVGGEFNAFTSHEFTGFYTKTASDHLELGLDVLSDMVLHATFPEEDLEREKGVIVEEINLYEDMPMRKVDHVLSALLFGDTPMGRPILGTKQSVTSFTVDDFIAYRNQFYKGAQCTVVIAGAVDPNHASKLVSTYFADLPKGEPYHFQPSQIRADGDRISLAEKKSEQTHLMLAVPAYPMTDPRRYALRLLATILGGNMSSRLFLSVRERQGLCYYVRAAADVYLDTGFLVASAGVDNTRVTQAIEAIMNEFRSIRDHGVEAAELDRAKQFISGKITLSLEDSAEVAEFYGLQDLLEHHRETPDQTMERIRAVSADDVWNVAKDIFVDGAPRLAIVGPGQDTSTINTLLTLA